MFHFENYTRQYLHECIGALEHNQTLIATYIWFYVYLPWVLVLDVFCDNFNTLRHLSKVVTLRLLLSKLWYSAMCKTLLHWVNESALIWSMAEVYLVLNMKLNNGVDSCLMDCCQSKDVKVSNTSSSMLPESNSCMERSYWRNNSLFITC